LSLLTALTLVSSSSQSLHDDGLVGVLASDGQDDLTDVDSGDLSVRLTPSTSHTLLQPIGTGTRQHLVDSDDVEGVGSDPQVEGVLSGGLDDVLVGTNSSSFQGFGRQLFVFVGDQVATEGEVVDRSLLSTQIVDSDLGVRNLLEETISGIFQATLQNVTYSPVVLRLGEGLVLAVSVASCGTSTHFD
jgi:hypothetical protein